MPQRSGCWICPFMDAARWRLLWERHPALFEKAARLEEIATERRGRSVTLDPSGKINLRMREAVYKGQAPMFDEETMAGLLAYKPCVCEL